MDKNKILNYIIATEIVTVTDITDNFGISYQQLISIIDNYNKFSFVNKIEETNGIISIAKNTSKLFVTSSNNRMVELELLWQTGIFDISELEIIFGRSRKTLYKDIQKIKRKLISNVNAQSIQNQFNKYTHERLRLISEYKQITVEQLLYSIAKTLTEWLDIDIDIEHLVSINLNEFDHQVYQEESKVLAAEIISSIQTYMKVKFINDTKIVQVQRHIYSSYYKYVNNAFINQTDLSGVIPKDRERYDKISTIITMVFKSKNLYYCDQELLYISLYFLDHQDFSYIRVKLVDVLGSGKLLVEKQLYENFDNFKLVDSNPDVTISTKANNADLKVNLKFDINDFKKLSQVIKLKLNRSTETKLYYKIQPLLKSSVTLEQFSSIYNQDVKYTKSSLRECLDDNGIYILDPTTNLQQTILLVSEILQMRGSVSAKYHSALVEQLNLYSNEFKLINNVALVHAPISEHIYKTDLVLLFSQHGFAFTNSSVKLIIAFSALDEVDLILPLQDIYQIISNSDFPSMLENVRDSEDFLSKLELCLANLEK